MLDKLFNKVYIITTINSERVDYCKEQLKNAGIEKYEFYTAFDSNLIKTNFNNLVGINVIPQKYISLSFGIISLLQSSLYSNYKNICICEDDIFFNKDWQSKLRNFIDNLPDDWDILNLGYADNIDDTIKINQYVKLLYGDYFGTHCVVYKNTSYKFVIDEFYKNKCNIPADWLFHRMCKEPYKCKIYIPVEHFILQVSESYLGNSNQECKQLFKSLINLPMNINKKQIEDFEYSFSEDNEIIFGDECRSIGYKSFSVCENVEKIVIPNNIEIISDKAFFDCKKLKEVYIGKNVKSIGFGVFKGCINLKKIIISEENSFYTVKDGCLYTKNLDTLLCYPPLKKDIVYETPLETKIIGENAFANNSYIKYLILNKSVEEIQSFAFNWCTELNSIIFLGNINKSGENIYSNCNNIKNLSFLNDCKLSNIIGINQLECLHVSNNIDIDSSVWQLDNYGVFKEVKYLNNFNLKENDLYIIKDNAILSKNETILYRVLPNIESSEYKCPSTIKTIYKWAFKYCKNLKNIELNNGLETIKLGAFENCEFEKIEIPDTVTTIEDFAFTWCNNLKKITLSNNLKTLGDAVFKDCNQLDNVIIPKSVEYTGKHLFELCHHLNNLVISEKIYKLSENIFKDSKCNPMITFWNGH